eukprot:COSAG01_NODE_2145_length_8304_cov_162.380256_9_plen_140_part_00
MQVVQLKAELKKRGLDTTGKKAQLEARLAEDDAAKAAPPAPGPAPAAPTPTAPPTAPAAPPPAPAPAPPPSKKRKATDTPADTAAPSSKKKAAAAQSKTPTPQVCAMLSSLLRVYPPLTCSRELMMRQRRLRVAGGGQR